MIIYKYKLCLYIIIKFRTPEYEAFISWLNLTFLTIYNNINTLTKYLNGILLNVERYPFINSSVIIII